MKYYILLIAGILSAIFLYIKIRNKSNSLWKELVIIYLLIIIGLLFGRLFSITEYVLAGTKFANISEFYLNFKIWQSSRWYGALFTGWIMLEFFSKIKFLKIHYISLITGICICTCLGLSIAKLGCFLDGHPGCGGIPTSLPWGVTYSWGTAKSNFPMHPVQIYDSIAYFILFILLLKIRKKTCTVLPIFIGSLAVYNLCVEFIIQNEILFFSNSLSFAQIIYSIMLVILTTKIGFSKIKKT